MRLHSACARIFREHFCRNACFNFPSFSLPQVGVSSHLVWLVPHFCKWSMAGQGPESPLSLAKLLRKKVSVNDFPAWREEEEEGESVFWQSVGAVHHREGARESRRRQIADKSRDWVPLFTILSLSPPPVSTKGEGRGRLVEPGSS